VILAQSIRPGWGLNALLEEQMDMASPKPLQVLPIPTLFDRAAAAFTNRPALSFEGRRWTYGELDAMVDRATAGLRRLGLQPGDKLGLCLPNTPYFVVF
jgi:long-chain acyl-CoA synthetase